MKEQAKVVTANRLIDGAVVYMTGTITDKALHDMGWSEDIKASVVATSQEQESIMLDQANTAVTNRLIVEPYLIPVSGKTPTALRATTLRERIRAQGPTIRLKDNRKPRPNPVTSEKNL